MTVAHLRPCTGCARHVRANTTTCPFCAASLSVDDVEPTLPQERLGRAARMAFGGAAVVAMTMAGCGKDNKENIAMPYGAPPDRTMNDASSTTPDPSSQNIAQPYGAPPMPVVDASTPNPSSNQPDASVADAGKKKVTTPTPTPTTQHTNVNKPYGAPPADGYDVFEV